MIQLFATKFETGIEGENVGVGRLKAFLEKNNENVELTYLDKTKSPIEQIDKILLNCKLYGFSMYHNNLEFFIKFANKIKNVQPEAIIVVGSKFVTAYYEEILREFKSIDIAILGDGEKALLDLVKHINENNDVNLLVSKHENLASRDYLEHKKAAVININELPWPDRSWIKDNNYISAYICDCHGCVGKCSFCTQTNYYAKWNGRTAKDIYEEIININNTCGIRHFIFTGGSFEDPGVLGKKKIRDLCLLLKENDKQFSFRYFLRADTFSNTKDDIELLKLMRACGFNLAVVGIEAGNDKDLKVYNKRATSSQNKCTLKLLESMDIYTGLFGFIMYNPYTTRETLTLNYRFLIEANASDLTKFVSKLTIHNKTAIFYQVKEDGLLTYQGKFYQDGGFLYKFMQPDIDEIYKFAQEYLDTPEIEKMSSDVEDSSDFIISFFEFVEGGKKYKDEMIEILKRNASILKMYFYHLYEKFDLQTCKDLAPQMINTYSNNVTELMTLRNKLFKQYIKSRK